MTTETRRRDGVSHAWLPLLGALAGAAGMWLALMSPVFMPGLPRFACRVITGGGHSMVVAAPTLEQTRERAQAMVGTTDASVDAARARLRVRADELRDAPAGPLSQLAPAAECAALLRARAELALTLAGSLSPSVTTDMPEGAPLSNELANADARLESAALAGDPSGVRGALLVSEAAEDRWLNAIQPEPRRRFAIWLARELDRSTQFLIAAEDLEALQTPYQRQLIRQWQPQFMLELESGVLGTLASMPSPGTVSALRARYAVWVVGLLAGALAGALIGLLARALLRVVERAGAARPKRTAVPGPDQRANPAPASAGLAAPMPPAARPVVAAREAASSAPDQPIAAGAAAPAEAAQPIAASARAPQPVAAQPIAAATAAHATHGARAVAPGPLLAPAVGEAWLHFVSAEDAARVARAAGEVAVPLIARGSRVLLIEAGQRLKLHESFGCAPRWGVGECLSGELPLLGTVQRAGVRDLYLLAAGSYPGRGSCGLLAGLIDEARRHFSAVVVALDARVPAEFRALAEGRRAEAWWPQRSGQLPRAALVFGERIGIPVAPFGLQPGSEHWLEALERRIEAVRAVLNPPRPAPLEPLAGEAAERPRATPAGATSGRPTMARPAAARPTASRPAVTLDPAVSVAPDPGGPRVYRPADEDERNRERLRFLMWMRQVRAERSKRDMTPVS